MKEIESARFRFRIGNVVGDAKVGFRQRLESRHGCASARDIHLPCPPYGGHNRDEKRKTCPREQPHVVTARGQAIGTL